MQDHLSLLFTRTYLLYTVTPVPLPPPRLEGSLVAPSYSPGPTTVHPCQPTTNPSFRGTLSLDLPSLPVSPSRVIRLACRYRFYLGLTRTTEDLSCHKQDSTPSYTPYHQSPHPHGLCDFQWFRYLPTVGGEPWCTLL